MSSRPSTHRATGKDGPRPGAPSAEPAEAGDRVVGFFPGLGSRAAYRDLGRCLFDAPHAAVAEVYREAAAAVGHPGRAERILFAADNLPATEAERQGFVGAAFLAHSLALDAHLRSAAAAGGVALRPVAYAGESFGILAAAVASGALACGDGVRIARAFTPLMMLAAEGATTGDPLALSLAAHLPESVRGRRLVAEPSHVVGLRGDPDDLAAALAGLARAYPAADVEVHKHYSRRQTNLYVRARVRPSFDMFMKNFSGLSVEDLKAPTTFLAHSPRMRGARVALSRFLDAEGVAFRAPDVPIVANHRPGLIETAAEVRAAVLAMVDETMDSRATVETLLALRPDAAVELGLGGRSLELLADNGSDVPAMAYTGGEREVDALVGCLSVMGDLQREMRNLHGPGRSLTDQHLDLMRGLFRHASTHAFCEAYLYRTMMSAIASEMLRSDRDRSPAFYRLLEVFQHTHRHRRSVDVATGELIFQAQSKKTIDGDRQGLGRVYSELKIVDRTGAASDRALTDADHPEAVVFRFDRLAGLGLAELARHIRVLLAAQPEARGAFDGLAAPLPRADGAARPDSEPSVLTVDEMASRHIVYQHEMFNALRRHRPAIFAQTDHYLDGGDLMGWLVALAASGACPLPDVVALYAAHLRAGAEADEEAAAALDGAMSSLDASDIPLISPAGVPVQAKKDLEAATRSLFAGDGAGAEDRRLHLNGDCRIVSLGAGPPRVSVEPYAARVVAIRSPAEIWERHANPALDELEELCLSSLTEDNAKVLRFARGRKLLSSTVFAYLNLGERIVGFGKGGSESMTMFFTREASLVG